VRGRNIQAAVLWGGVTLATNIVVLTLLTVTTKGKQSATTITEIQDKDVTFGC
jgi:hypothetical protein